MYSQIRDGRLSHTQMRLVKGKIRVGLGRCQECYGFGTCNPEKLITCPRCYGKGEILCHGRHFGFWRTCAKCRGAQKIKITLVDVEKKCPRCKGVNSMRFEKGSVSDSIHPRILARIPYKVYRLKNDLPYHEREFSPHLSSTYGCNEVRTQNVRLVKGNRVFSASGSRICRPDGTICDHFGIFIQPTSVNTVFVAPVFPDTVLPEMKRVSELLRAA